MADSSSDENEEFTFYRDRPEWKDVTPIPQEELDGHEGQPIVSIDYTPAFKDVYDYFRAILKSGEKSERALELTYSAASLNPANYTVWQYRREILKALNKDIKEELKISEHFILNNTKNYQIWHHRKVLVEWLQDPSEEKAITEAVLNKDEKNYHAWQHRQWVIKTFNLFDGELDYVDHLLSNDIRNNSAWNQRYFVIKNITEFTEDVIDREIDYTLSKIKLVTLNESAWNYLRGLLLNQEEPYISQNKKVTQFCEDLYASGNRSPFLLALIIDMCHEQIGKGSSDTVYTLERGKELCNDLATKYDTIRAKYWEYMANQLEKVSKGEPVDESEATT